MMCCSEGGTTHASRHLSPEGGNQRDHPEHAQPSVCGGYLADCNLRLRRVWRRTRTSSPGRRHGHFDRLHRCAGRLPHRTSRPVGSAGRKRLSREAVGGVQEPSQVSEAHPPDYGPWHGGRSSVRPVPLWRTALPPRSPVLPLGNDGSHTWGNHGVRRPGLGSMVTS